MNKELCNASLDSFNLEDTLDLESHANILCTRTIELMAATFLEKRHLNINIWINKIHNGDKQMAEGSLLTDAIKALIGKVYAPTLSKLEDGSIQRFAEAVGDFSPLFIDIAYAKKSKHRRLVAPPSFTGWPLVVQKEWDLGFIGDLMKAGVPPNLLDGGVTYEYFDYIHSGDTLMCASKIENIVEKTQKSGAKMLIVTMEATYTNQYGKVVLKQYRDVIFR